MRTKAITTPAAKEQQQRRHLEELLDKALADSFPASDPLSSLATDEGSDQRQVITPVGER